VTDLLLLLVAVFWGTNYAVVKHAFGEIEPQAFNGVRMSVASVLFLLVIGGARVWLHGTRANGSLGGEASSVFYTPAVMTAREWSGLAALGFVGNCVYQYCFMAGLARTSVANSSLLIAATPMLVALLSAGLGLERISRLHWMGVLLSLAGIYLVVGNGFSAGGGGHLGDILMFVAAVCWAIYTIGARPLMARHSPVAVTGLAMTIGTLMYLPLTWPAVRAASWRTVSWATWAALGYSAVFSLCVSYTIWYFAIRKIGTARTSVYTNVAPIVAMLTAFFALDEPIGVRKLVGAAAVLAGVAMTRIVPK
jgi:drug/metabolite transporter (DMT)-like permease